MSKLDAGEVVMSGQKKIFLEICEMKSKRTKRVGTWHQKYSKFKTQYLVYLLILLIDKFIRKL